MANKTNRSNLWGFIIYPNDSAPENYLAILDNLHVKIAISPLHDPDEFSTNEDEKRKQHIHIVLKFNGLKSFDQVQELVAELKGTRPIILHSESSYIRYLIHYDHNDKQQFGKDPAIIKTFGGYNIDDFFLAKDHTFVTLDKIEELICDNGIDNFYQLCRFLKANYFIDELMYIRTNSYYISKYLDGLWQLHHKPVSCDTYTGEIIEKE